MAARILYDRVDLHRIGMEPGIPAHHFYVEVFLVAATATARQQNAHQD